MSNKVPRVGGFSAVIAASSVSETNTIVINTIFIAAVCSAVIASAHISATNETNSSEEIDFVLMGLFITEEEKDTETKIDAREVQPNVTLHKRSVCSLCCLNHFT